MHTPVRSLATGAARAPRLVALALLVLVGLLAGCGGGGGGSLASAGPGGIDRSGQSTGTLSGFGSVFVNGVEYDTRTATITKDGQSAAESDLRVGQWVTVTGTVDANGTTGTATRIVFDDNVQGPIAAIDLANDRMVVLGQTVQVDLATVFDGAIAPASLAGLAVGDVVEVSGLVDAAGVIRATRIDRVVASEVEITGTVSALDADNKLFTLGTQRIDYGTATLSGFPAANPVNGQRVEVKGSAFSGGTLQATRVELKSTSLVGSDGQRAEVEGLITRFANAQDFDVAGQRVSTSGSTTYENGSASNLALGVRVEVKGTVTSGTLAATKVELKLESSQRVDGRVQSIDRTAGRFTVLGVVVAVDGQTQFEDNSATEVRRFSLDDVNVGDYVQVRGTAGSGDVDIRATRVERDNGEDESEVRGSVTAFGDPTFVINGVTVTVDDSTRIKDRNGDEISRGAFFAGLASGDVLEVKGASTGTAALDASEIEYED